MDIGYTLLVARKNVAFKIRIEEELRRAFVEVCQAEDRPAAQVLREFMRNYVAERQAALSAGPASEREATLGDSENKKRRGH